MGDAAEQRAKARAAAAKRRCKHARGRADNAYRDAMVARDKAYAAARSAHFADDSTGDGDDQIRLDNEIMMVEQAVHRCDSIRQRARVVSVPGQVERLADACVREAAAADQHARRAIVLSKDTD